jgi:nitroimidazol reductase NimA-like FMN-containing flavoprotein (pyridoxamine 5'-phosphate oxidase superfamily)
MTLGMTRAEREAFLAGTHVAIVSVADGVRGPLTVPVWYRYEPGGVVFFVTAKASRKAGLIRTAGRLSLCVQTETPPYLYVTVEGPARLLGEPDREVDVRAIAHRYLGEQMGEMYLTLTAEQHAPGLNVVVRLDPERWITADFRKMVP